MLTMPTEKKVVLTDIDGVVISWQSGLPYFAQKYDLPLAHILQMIVDDKFVSPAELFDCSEEFADKLICKYNDSDFIRYLAPYSDALKVINELKTHYEFVAVTALGDSVDAHLNRKFNLNALFPGAFKEIMMCAHNGSKLELFKQAKEKYGDRVVCYIDDLSKHVESCESVFGDAITYMHMVRGPRDGRTSFAKVINDWANVRGILAERVRFDIQQTMIEELLRNSKRYEPGFPKKWTTTDFPITTPMTPHWQEPFHLTNRNLEWYYNQPKCTPITVGKI